MRQIEGNIRNRKDMGKDREKDRHVYRERHKV